MGISYLAANQWQVAAMNPPHLAAIMPWEGFSNFYRELTHQGGILANFFVSASWWPNQILKIQNGNGNTPFRDRETGALTTGAAIPEAELIENRIEFFEEFSGRPFEDEWYRARTADLSKIEVPILSAGNWGGLGLHLRGNVEGYLAAGSSHKWLELHGGTHYESFYKPEWISLQRQFFDRFLKGEQSGWDERARVMLHVRHPDRFEYREEHEWPIARTRWKRVFLNASESGIAEQPSEQEGIVSYDPLGNGVEFMAEPFSSQQEITGPLSARLWVETSAADADFFVTLRLYDPRGQEVSFEGASEAAVPITQGWLRLSHREQDLARSTEYRPLHAHLRSAAVSPDTCYPIEVELWPTSIVVPKGYRIALLVEGRDFSRSPTREPRTGSGPFLHNDPTDRDPSRLQGVNRIRTGGSYDSSLLLPIVPSV
ncbi:Cocaine esterase [compost metagenome]